MCFNPHLRGWTLQRRSVSDIQDSPMYFPTGLSMNRINTSGWKEEPSRVQVCSGKTKLSPKFISLDHSSGQGVGTPQHLARGIQVSCSNRFTDPSTANAFAVQ